MNIRFFGAALRRPPVARPKPLDAGLVGTIALYTEYGPIPAPLLSPGDRVIRRGQGPVAIHSVETIAYRGQLVRVAPDAFGRARPDEFLLLPPGQRLNLRRSAGAAFDGVFEARELVDGGAICWHDPEEVVTLIQLDFGQPEIIHAGGLELEIS